MAWCAHHQISPGFAVHPLAAIALLFLAVVTAPGRAAGAASPRVEAEVSSTSVTVGQPVTLRLSVTAPDLSGIVISEPVRPDDMSSTWSLVARRDLPEEVLAGGEARRTVEYTLAPFATGPVELPRYEVGYYPKDGPPTTTSLPAQTIQVVSVLPSDAAAIDPHDIKPPVEVPFPRWILVAAALAVLALLALLLRGWWAVMRRRLGRMIRPEKRLDIWALDELAALEGEKLIEQKKVREFYTRLTDVVRAYLGRLFGINALDLTSTELLWKLESDTTVSDEVRSRVAELLNEADLVKFARHIPEAPACRRALERGRSVVESTVSYLQPVSSEEGTSPPGAGPSAVAPAAGPQGAGSSSSSQSAERSAEIPERAR